MVLRMRAVDVVEDAGFIPLEAINADEAMTTFESRSDISLRLIASPGRPLSGTVQAAHEPQGFAYLLDVPPTSVREILPVA